MKTNIWLKRQQQLIPLKMRNRRKDGRKEEIERGKIIDL